MDSYDAHQRKLNDELSSCREDAVTKPEQIVHRILRLHLVLSRQSGWYSALPSPILVYLLMDRTKQDRCQQSADTVRLAEESSYDLPQEALIRQVMPEVADNLRTLQRQISVFANQSEMRHVRTDQGLADIKNHINLLYHGSFVFQPPTTIPSVPSSPAPAPVLSFVGPAAPTNPVVQNSSTVSSPSTSSAVYSSASASSPVSALPPLPGTATTDVPVYQMSRTIQSVTNLWREWSVGMPGQPAVQDLESSYGAAWRKKDCEWMFFSRRKVIIDEIVRRNKASGLPSILQTVEEIECLRVQGKMTLNQLSKMLRKRS